jgi:hypothetical protein
MKLSKSQQEELDQIRKHVLKYGPCGSGELINPETQIEKRRRKLYDLGVVLLVGLGEESKEGFYGGVGIIPADMFDIDKHTKLTLDWQPICKRSVINEREKKIIVQALRLISDSLNPNVDELSPTKEDIESLIRKIL